MSTYSVVYGGSNLVAIYGDGELIATHDKFSKESGDLERAIKVLEGKGTVLESKGDFSKFSEIPPKHEEKAVPVEEKEPEQKSYEVPAENTAKQAETGTMKGTGEVQRKILSRNGR